MPAKTKLSWGNKKPSKYGTFARRIARQETKIAHIQSARSGLDILVGVERLVSVSAEILFSTKPLFVNLSLEIWSARMSVASLKADLIPEFRPISQTQNHHIRSIWMFGVYQQTIFAATTIKIGLRIILPKLSPNSCEYRLGA